MEKLLEFKRNIISWYPIKNGESVLQIGEDEFILEALKEKTDNIKTVEKPSDDDARYDYITLIGYFDKLESEEDIRNIIKYSSNHLNKNGKILLAMKNRFGMKYFSGDKYNNLETYESIEKETDTFLGKGRIERMLYELGLKYKFYYPLPDYEYTNVIYSNDFMPTEDSIEQRDLTLCSNNAYLNFSEKNAYKQLLKEERNLFPFFANSYFIEISNQDNFTDVRFVSFGIIRKKEHRIKTIISKNNVYKCANSIDAKEHMEALAKNISILNDLKIPNIGKAVDNTIECKFLANAKSYDEYLMDIYKKDGLNGVINKITDYKKNFLDVLYDENYSTNRNIFDKYKVYVPDRIKEKLHFVKHGMLDLIFQNLLVENGIFGQKIYAYDQEWYEENVPIEFILYRSLFYFSEIQQTEDINEIYRTFGLDEFLGYFVKLENNFQDELTDKETWQLHYDAVSKIHYETELFKDYEKKKIENEEYKKQISDLNFTLSQKEQEIQNYSNQLSLISNSLSWKLTKPFRIISWVLNPFSKASFIDRIMPPGGRRRIEYDQKQSKKKYEKRVENYFKLSDEKTAEYWKGIDHRKYLLYEKLLKKQTDEDVKRYEKYQFNNMLTDQEYDLEEKEKFSKKPKISIVIPLFNTDPDYFRELLYSIHLQSYKNWELCLADGSLEEQSEIKSMIENDKRIKYKFLGKNGGISENTNEAIKMATGDYLFLCDHDDMLEFNTLYEIVKVINENGADFIYSDEDKFHYLDEPYFAPHFKPDYAPDTLCSQNYICHICCFKKSLYDETEGFNGLYNGAQDYDIILKLVEIAKHIVHIPKVLYHWRVSSASTAMTMEAKPYAIEAGKKAIESHLERIGAKGKVFLGLNIGSYGIDYEVEGNPKVTILIRNYNEIDNLDRCISSILSKTTYQNYEVCIIDENSYFENVKSYYKELEKEERVTILYYDKFLDAPSSFNFGINNSHGDYIIVLDNTAEILTENWIERMLGFIQRSDVGAVGVKIYNPDYTIKNASYIIGGPNGVINAFEGISKIEHSYFERENLIQNVNAVSALCMMIKRSTVEEIGLFDEEYSKSHYDIDYSLRLREKGYLIVYNPYVEIISYERDANNELNDFEEEWNGFMKMGDNLIFNGVLGNGEKLDLYKKVDEYYNPNMSLEEVFEVKTEKIG